MKYSNHNKKYVEKSQYSCIGDLVKFVQVIELDDGYYNKIVLIQRVETNFKNALFRIKNYIFIGIKNYLITTEEARAIEHIFIYYYYL